MQPPHFLRRGFPASKNVRFPMEGTRGEGNEAAALEARGCLMGLGLTLRKKMRKNE